MDNDTKYYKISVFADEALNRFGKFENCKNPCFYNSFINKYCSKEGGYDAYPEYKSIIFPLIAKKINNNVMQELVTGEILYTNNLGKKNIENKMIIEGNHLICKYDDKKPLKEFEAANEIRTVEKNILDYNNTIYDLKRNIENNCSKDYYMQMCRTWKHYEVENINMANEYAKIFSEIKKYIINSYNQKLKEEEIRQ